MARQPKGFSPRIFTQSAQIDSKLKCSSCNHILKDPVQGECGHRFCMDCMTWLTTRATGRSGKIRCPGCVEEKADDEPETYIGGKQMIPDHGARRELQNLQVNCINTPCTWNGLFKDYITHEQTCQFKTKGAECAEKEYTCPYACDRKLEDNLEDHLKKNSEEHLLRTWINSKKALDIAEFAKVRLQKLESEKTAMYPVHTQFSPSLSQDQLQGLEQSNQQTRSLLQIFHREIQTLRSTVDNLDPAERIRTQEEKTQKYEQKIQNLERVLTLKDVMIRELQARVEGLECTTHNGQFLWVVNNVLKRRNDAMNGRVMSIFSPAFYSSPSGYKMCCRLYLNGDGSGRGSHLSIFFVIMRGPYDPILQWPFRQKVTIRLIDVSSGGVQRHVTDSFKPDPNSNSFQPPTTDMNIATGFPMFMPLKDLEDNHDRYVKDDKLFIAVSVDTKNLDSLMP